MISLSIFLVALPLHTAFTSSFRAPSLSKVRPLSTANAETALNIPRLEVGLRIMNRELGPEINQVLSFSNPLEWLRFSGLNKIVNIVKQEAISTNNLFGDLVARASSGFINYIRKVISASLVIAGSLMSPVNIRQPIAAAAAIVGSVIAAPLTARAGVLRKYSKLSPTQRLATTPVFFLANSNGQPYLQDDVQTGNSDQRIIVYFMSSEDAYDYMDEMVQAGGSGANEFRVMASSMEKVVNKIQTKKQSRKLGRYPVGNVFRIQPSIRQCENAEKLLSGSNSKKVNEKLTSVSIPMFSAKGMAIKRASGEVFTPFYFSLEDLKEDWAKLGDQNQNKLVINVHDISEVMLLSSGVSKNAYSTESSSRAIPSDGASYLSDSDLQSALISPAIVPPRREVDMLRRFYRNDAGIKNENGEARIMGSSR